MGAVTQPDLSGVSPEVMAYIGGISKGYDEMVEQLEKATKVIEELTDEDDTDTGDDESDETDDDGDDDDSGDDTPVGKSGDDLTELLKAHPALQGVLGSLKKAADDATKRADAAERMAKAERDNRLTAEFITKARSLDGLAIEHEPVAKALREMAEKVSKDANEAIWKALSAANEQAKTGVLFDEIGSAGPGSRDGEPGDQLEKTARKLMAADKDLDYPSALVKAVADDPSLYVEYVDQVRKEPRHGRRRNHAVQDRPPRRPGRPHGEPVQVRQDQPERDHLRRRHVGRFLRPPAEQAHRGRPGDHRRNGDHEALDDRRRHTGNGDRQGRLLHVGQRRRRDRDRSDQLRPAGDVIA